MTENKHVAWRLMVMLLVGCCAGCGANGEDAVLTVMSFNVRYGTAADGANAWPHRKDLFADMLKTYAPDLLGTQECLEFQAEFIAQALSEYRWIGIGREADGKGEMAAVFYKKDRFIPIATGHFWLSETPDVPGSKSWESHCTRMVTWVRFRDLKTGSFFLFFNTHFDHGSEEARQHSARLLLDRVNAAASDLPIIVTGDFNAAAEHCAAWDTLIGGGFADAWVTAAERVGSEVTYGNFGPPEEGKQDRIDWILLRGPIKAQRCETATYNQSGKYPSDHFPVVARLVLGP